MVKLSEKNPVNIGVPQWSILGPLLFILFINDLPKALEESDADMYADESTHTAQAKGVPELEQKLTTDAYIVSDWCNENLMSANATKTSHVYYILTKKNLFPREAKNT